jgi:phospholipid/cholesterol/gamma-HCH transport system substrate-binding protein
VETLERSELKYSPKSGSDGHTAFFTLVALFLLLCSWTWLKGWSVFHAPQRFNVAFHDAAALNVDGAVNVDGIRVGTVEKLLLRGKHDVLVGLRINTDKIKIPQGSRFQIFMNGVVGAKYVEITLPDVVPGQPAPPPLDMNTPAIGDDPVRPELVINKVAENIASLDLDAIEHKMDSNMTRLVAAADHLDTLSQKFMPVADRALVVENSVASLSEDLSGTTKKLNRILDNPNFSADLKETAQRAKETSQNIQAAIHELNTTLSDKPFRQDLITMMSNLNESTQQIRKTALTVQQMGDDKGLRSDLKQIMSDARDTMNKVDQVVSKPTFGADLKTTLQKTQSAVDHMDLVSRQMNQILDKKHPLLHLMMGRPGHLKIETKTVKIEKAGNAVKAQDTVKVEDQAVKVETQDSNVQDPAIKPQADKLEQN